MTSHSHRATIESVPAGVDRPLWSVMIPTYNCARYLSKTLESVLEQAPGPELMQIEVVDDCSSLDDPAAVVRDVGGGRVRFFRQEQNQGHVRNFATCLQRSRGQLVHLLHGDDWVQPGFYAAMAAAFATAPEVGLATCRHLYAEADGHWFGISRLRQEQHGVWPTALHELAMHADVQTPSVVVRRDCYERLGGFDDRLRSTEDYEMWVRIAAHYPVWYEPECLAVYRFHGGSNTARDSVNSENLRDLHRAIAIVDAEHHDRLPPDWQRTLLRRTATIAIDRAEQYGHSGQAASSVAAYREAIRSDASIRTVLRVGRSVARLGWRAIVRAMSGGTDR